MDLVDGLVAASVFADLERSRFVQTGDLVRSVSDDALAVVLAEVSRHHAWRAAQWADLVRAPLPPAVSDRVATGGDDTVAAPVSTDAEVEHWLRAELADLIERVGVFTAGLDPIGDGPLVRTAARVLEDLHSDQKTVSEPSR